MDNNWNTTFTTTPDWQEIFTDRNWTDHFVVTLEPTIVEISEIVQGSTIEPTYVDFSVQQVNGRA